MSLAGDLTTPSSWERSLGRMFCDEGFVRERLLAI